jgi:hypothetical protein
MDFSKCINIKKVLAKDAFKPGVAYRILIHDIRLMNIVTLFVLDDDDMDAYNKDIEALANTFDKTGFDAVCIEMNESEAIFVSSYIGSKPKKLSHFKINITADIIVDIINSEAALVTPPVEILEMKPVVPDMLFRDTENPTKKPINPKSDCNSWIARLFSKEDQKED